MLWRITVKGGFSPQNQQAQVGDAVFWINDDTQPHQPYPTSGKPGDWGPVIPAGASSDQVNMTTSGVVPYKCALHSTETGTLNVATAVIIGPGPDGKAAFGPGALKIKTGQSVSWGNSDANPHQPTPDAGSPWLSAPVDPGDTSAVVPFNTAGSYPYHCALHAGETGTITVA